MKISFQQQSITETEMKHTEKTNISGEHTGHVGVQRAYYAEFGREQMGVSAKQGEKGKSLIELQQEAANINAAVQQDYMTLMSNTMSEEDYAKLQEEGFDFESMKPEEAVTIVDKIKAELVRSGKQIAGYTDDLDMDTLTAALGSRTLAQAVADSFRASDIPLTEENISAVSGAWSMASQLKPLEDGGMVYLIDNRLEAEIWNLYLAQNSGADRTGNGIPRFFAEDVQGYYARSADVSRTEELSEQIDRVLEQCGRETDEGNRQYAAWLVEKGLPLTKENLNRLEELKTIELPVSEQLFAERVATAVAGGKAPAQGQLTGETESIYEKAVRIDSYFRSEEALEAVAGNGDFIAARRQLEEIRLRMTAEVNIKLLKSGFSIDTAPIEELVDALKTAEQELADSYFPEDAQAVQKYRTYCEANEIMTEFPGLPARALGTFLQGRAVSGTEVSHESDGSAVTLSEFYGTGKAMQEKYEKAGESYEALMTKPRGDMGDSIRKAFANVDDILNDLGLELSEENRRAVRILGYNRMEMTVENLDSVKEADWRVQTIIGKMTPASTLKMIRDGINPMEKSFEELEAYFDTLPEEYGRETDSYSRFLYGLEKNGEITAGERESYIGIYRLVHQIEKSDGAAVGALVNANAEVHFSNLLSAVRSRKFKSMDVRATDELGTVSELIRKGETIPEQIARAFVKEAKTILTEVSYGEEAEREYSRLQLEQFKNAVVSAQSETAAMLEKGELPASAGNLLAAEALTQEEKNLFAMVDRRGVAGQSRTADASGRMMGRSAMLWEKLEDKQKFVEEYRELTQDAKSVLEEVTLEQCDTAIDVRGMQLLHKQLTVMSSLERCEEFFLPVYVGDMLTRVHLSFERDGREKGSVRIDVRFTEGEQLSAQLSLSKGEIRGIFAGRTTDEVMKLEKIADIFKQKASGNWSVGSIGVVGAVAQMPGMDAGSAEDVENTELYRVAKVFLQAVEQGVKANEN